MLLTETDLGKFLGRQENVEIIFCESTTYISGDPFQTCVNINVHEAKDFEENRYSAKAINF